MTSSNTSEILMEFKEVSKISCRLNLFRAFSIIDSNDGNRFAILNAQHNNGFIYDIEYVPESITAYSLCIESIEIERKSLFDLSRLGNMKEIYRKSNILERQTLTIDPLYSFEYSSNPMSCILTEICWPTSDSDCLAVISNYGQCEIRSRDILNRNWNIVRIDIGKMWTNIGHVFYQNVNNFQELTTCVDDMHITTCCWDENTDRYGKGYFYIATASGKIISFDIADTTKATIVGIFSTNFYKISYIKQFEAFNQSFMIVSDINGQIQLLRYVKNDGNWATIENNLWKKKDKMRCSRFNVYCCQRERRIFLSTTKMSHFLIFALSENGILLHKITKYVENIEITGFIQLQNLEFIAVTSDGNIEYIKFDYLKEKLQLISSIIITSDLSIENHYILGFKMTKNKSTFIFATYPNRTYNTYLNQKPTNLYFAMLTTKNPIDLILMNSTQKLNNLNDTLEMIKCAAIKGLLTERLENFNPEPVGLNEEFLYRLKIYYNLSLAKCNYYRRLNNYQRSAEIEACAGDISNIITAIICCIRLNRLASLDVLTKFQKLAARCIRKTLKDFRNSEIHESVTEIKTSLMPIFEESISESKHLVFDVIENCSYCSKPIDIDTMKCSDDHIIPRCCITFVQVPMFSKRCCKQCNSIALDDETLLKEISLDEEEPLCPLCDSDLKLQSNRIVNYAKDNAMEMD